jgi:protein-L-isoaspartate(D-aspartate) O-methyltransferase
VEKALSELHFDGIGMTSKRTRIRMIQRLEEQGIRNGKVLQIIANTPRHWFLDEALAHRAYEDTALPIGHGQTLSQPYIVARMTELLLDNHPAPRKVLEIGTGSGYQTSILAQLVEKVWTVERIRPLQSKARERLARLRLYNVHYKYADGGFGWADQGPYDGIISTAAPISIPADLLAQIAPDGVLIIPVGPEHNQQLTLVKRDGNEDQYHQTVVEPVRFVPLVPGIT